MAVIADEHGYRSGSDDDIAQPAESIGNLSENEEAEDGRENDLAVIVNRNFTGGGVGIGCCDGELTAGCRQTCQKQGAQLRHRHGMEAENQIRQSAYAGEGREKEYDERPFYPAGTQCPHIGICHTCHQTSQQTDQGWEARQIGRAGFDNKEGACESSYHAKSLKQVDLFFQYQDAEQDGKEGGHLIQHGSVRQHQMIYSIEIAEDADGATERTKEQEFLGILIQLDFRAFLQQNHQSKKHCYKIAEEALLDGGQVTRQAYEHIHQCKGERGKQDTADPFIFLCHWRTSFLVSASALE